MPITAAPDFRMLPKEIAFKALNNDNHVIVMSEDTIEIFVNGEAQYEIDLDSFSLRLCFDNNEPSAHEILEWET